MKATGSLDRIERASSVSSDTSSSSSSSSSSRSSSDEKDPLLSATIVPKRRSSSLAEDPYDNADEVEYLYEQDFFALRAECLKAKKLFEDPEFPADNDLLRKRSARHFDDLEWLRPHEFIRPEEPILVSDRNEGFDIRVGLDSWFVPAMSAVAESEALLNQVVPKDQGFTAKENYAGIFHFRFWFGRWIEIVVDDRLPIKNGTPLYMKSACVEEFWPALLEKAYAKAKGSYELLNHWMPIDGCIELTGGVPERVRNLPDLLSMDARHADRLFFDLLRASQLGNIILATTAIKTRQTKLCLAEASQLGLHVKYAYRVTRVAYLGEGQQLIRVKNCSGPLHVNWIGAWHPTDTRWANVSDDIKKELETETYQDGGFWMAYGDFLKYFKTVDICHLNHEVDQDITFHGRWEVGLNAGGVQKGDFKNYSKNPQCFIRLNDSDPSDPDGRCSAVISLMQRREPKSRAKGLNQVGFKVYRVEDQCEELSTQFFAYRRNDGYHKCVAKTPTWQDGRETNIRVRLSPGKYCIIPSTFFPDREGDFILRVHIERYSRERTDELMKRPLHAIESVE